MPPVSKLNHIFRMYPKYNPKIMIATIITKLSTDCQKLSPLSGSTPINERIIPGTHRAHIRMKIRPLSSTNLLIPVGCSFTPTKINNPKKRQNTQCLKIHPKIAFIIAPSLLSIAFLLSFVYNYYILIITWLEYYVNLKQYTLLY